MSCSARRRACRCSSPRTRSARSRSARARRSRSWTSFARSARRRDARLASRARVRGRALRLNTPEVRRTVYAAPARGMAGETSAQRADALQVGRGLSSGREGTVANDDHFRVPADTGLVADRPRDVLHQRLEILAFDAGLEVRKPARRIGRRIRHAVMVQGFAVTPDSEFAHASLLTGVQPNVGIERLATGRGKKRVLLVLI